MQCNRGLVQVCESYNGTLLLINFIQNAQIRLVRSKQFKSFVVGYQDFGTGGWVTMAGTPFLKIGDTEGWDNATTLIGNDVVAGDTAMKFSSFAWDLDSWIFNGYDAATSESLGWAYAYTNSETWEPEQTVIASFKIQTGDTVVFQPADGMSGLTVAGQVVDTKKPATWTLEAGEWIGDIMNPYPVATTFADIETFAVVGDTLLVFNPTFWDLDSFIYNGQGQGWAVGTSDGETWEPIQYVEMDSTKVVLPAGIGGVYQPADQGGRTWTVTL